MRKVLPILLAIALAVPALADVTVTVDEGDLADGIAEINLAIDGGSVVRGLALKVTITDADATIDDLTDLTDVMAGFNAYIDYYYSNPDYLTVDLSGDETQLPGAAAVALADPDAAGVLDLASPASVFSISLGALDNSGAQGGIDTGGLLCKIDMSGNFGLNLTAEVCVEADALRGGIVGDDLGTVSDADCETIAKDADPECFNDNLGNYAEWVQFGSPPCWCYEYNCRGDADGGKQGSILAGYSWVFTNDLTVLSAAYSVKEPPKGLGIDTIPNGICADFARDQQGSILAGYARVFTNDLGILSASYSVKDPPKGLGLTSCPLAGAGGEINYYEVP